MRQDAMHERFADGLPFPRYLETVEKNEALWHAVYERVELPEDVLSAFRALPGTSHLLVLSEDWCGDAANIVPVVARLAEHLENVDLRILTRDGNPELMDTHLTGRSRSIPVVMFLDEDFVERGWWGPRPSKLQHWVVTEGLKMESRPRYREIRAYYARDKGRSTLAELLEAMEAASYASDAPPARDGTTARRRAHIPPRSTEPVDVASEASPTTMGPPGRED